MSNSERPPSIIKRSESRKSSNVTKNSFAYLDKLGRREYVKSYFSDEDSKSDDDIEITEDILRLAKRIDKLKASRNDLMMKMGSNVTSGKLPDGGQKSNRGHETGPSKVEKIEPRETVEMHTFQSGHQTQRKNMTEEERARSRHDPQDFDSDSSDDFNDNEDPIGKEPPVTEVPKAFTGHNINKSREHHEETPEPSEKSQKTEKTDKLSRNLSKNFSRNLSINRSNEYHRAESRISRSHDHHYNRAESRIKTAKTSSFRSVFAAAPAIEGYLKKKSTNFFRLWQKRYYTLKDKKLFYYKNETKDTMLGVLDFDLVSVKLERQDKKHFKIIPIGGSRTFSFAAPTEEETQKWYELIDKAIQNSVGYILTLKKVVCIPRFWKNDRISNFNFIEKADTGDILLFKTKAFGATLQRSFTRSEYDHVGLLLRYNNGEIVLFEASGKEGVGLCRWRTFMKNKWYMLFHKIVYRKLYGPKTLEMMGGIEKFVRYSVGKKYQLNASKLLKKKSVTNMEDEDRTFFCSELVAACYKKIGLLPKDISAARYLPGTFSAEKKLELFCSASLGDESLIDFNL